MSDLAGDMPIAIDAHAHVFERGLRLDDGRRYTPDFDAPLSRFLEKLDQYGMTHGVLVQPSFLGTDNSYLAASLRRAGGRLRGVAVVDPIVAREELLSLDQAGVSGIRLNLLGQDMPDLGAARWRSLLASVRELGWHVEVQRGAFDLASIVPPLLDAGLPVVLDHFGLPDPAVTPSDPGFVRLLALGRSGNVWVKLSAPYRIGPGGERVARLLYPSLRDAFGLDRLMWGSDWPHTQFEGTQDYETACRLLTAMVSNDLEAATLLASPWKLFRF